MVVGFVSRLGWRHDGRALLVVVRSRTADGGDSNSAVSEALFTRKAGEEIKDQLAEYFRRICAFKRIVYASYRHLIVQL
ncbi:hypothetical protein JHK87_043541 [Glycine soja]|nr:hypothetical protein JHK87_043541 [Glycine soja]